MAAEPLSAGLVDQDGNNLGPCSIDTYEHTMTMTDQNGQLVTMELGTSDVHIDAALANIAFGFKQPDAMADMFSPVYPVAKQSNFYNAWDKDDVLQEVGDDKLIVSPGGVVSEIGPRLNRKRYSAEIRALATVVIGEVEQNADAPLNIQSASVMRLMNLFILARERRVATLLQKTASFDSSDFFVTLGATAKWNGGSTSDPIADLQRAIENSLMPIKKIGMARRTFNSFWRNANVQKFVQFKSAISAQPTPEQINDTMAFAQLPPIHVSDMKYKSGSAAYSYVWGDDVVLVHDCPPTASQMDISTSGTFRWVGGATPDEESIARAGQGWIVRSYFDQRRGPRGAKVTVVTHADAEVMVSGSVGGLIKAAFQ